MSYPTRTGSTGAIPHGGTGNDNYVTIDVSSIEARGSSDGSTPRSIASRIPGSPATTAVLNSFMRTPRETHVVDSPSQDATGDADPDMRNDPLETAVRGTISAIGHDLETPDDITETVTDATMEALERYSLHRWTSLLNATTVHARLVGRAIVRACFGETHISPNDVTASELQAIAAPAIELVVAFRRYYCRHDPAGHIPRFHYLMDERLARTVDDSLALLRLHSSLQEQDVHVAKEVLGKPTDSSTPAVTLDVSDDTPKDDSADVPSTTVNVTTHAPFIDRHTNINPKPDLLFPDVKPPRSASHYSGYYTIGEDNSRRWISYEQPLTPSELPLNVGMTDDHWTDITLPNGTYVDGRGNRIPSTSRKHPSATTPRVRVNGTGRPVERHPMQYAPATPSRQPSSHSWYQTPVDLSSGNGTSTPGISQTTPGFAGTTNNSIHGGTGGSGAGNPGRAGMGSGGPGHPGNAGTGGGGPGGSGYGGAGGGGPGDPGYDPFANSFSRFNAAFKPKLDTTVYPDLRDRRLFHTWFAKVRAHARVHRVDMLLDPTYVPPHDDMESFWLRQHWLYSVLQSKIHYIGGKQIIRRHAFTGDAQRVLQELHQDAIDSVGGALHSQDLFKSLVSMQLDSRWHKPLTDFLHKFQETVDEYHERTYPKPPIPDDVLKSFLIQSIESHPVLRDVTARDREHGLRYRRVFTYHEFFEACMALADVHDTAKRPPVKRHQVHHADLHEHPATNDAYDTFPNTADAYDDLIPDGPMPDDHANVPSINATTSVPRVPDDIWKRLPKEVQRTWSTIPVEHRAAILGGTPRHAALTDASCASPSDVPPEASGSDDGVVANATKRKSSFANPAERQDALHKATPGDMRRVLSQPGTQPGTKSDLRAHQLVSEYWSNDRDFR